MAYERNFGNVTYNVLFNPPEYLVATINAPEDVATLPVYTIRLARSAELPA